MFIVSTYPLAVFMCVITMLCWGSWANTQKLAAREWPFPLFYWDYCLGIVFFALLFGLTLGSFGEEGRSMIQDLSQASLQSYISAFIGGVIFNIANLLLVAAIDIAGMSVAFPVGIGLALVIGVVDNYIKNPVGNPWVLFTGVLLVAAAIIINAVAYRRLSTARQSTSTKGITLSLAAGVLMGFFYGFVAQSMDTTNFALPEVGKFTPYSAVFIFTIGIFLSSFLWNSYFMYRPVSGNRVKYADYFQKGDLRLHTIGILGGLIWCVGMSFSFIAAEQAGPAISYGLGQGATMVAAFWGVFIWKEFKEAPPGTNRLITLMFVFFILGLGVIIAANVV